MQVGISGGGDQSLKTLKCIHFYILRTWYAYGYAYAYAYACAYAYTYAYAYILMYKYVRNIVTNTRIKYTVFTSLHLRDDAGTQGPWSLRWEGNHKVTSNKMMAVVQNSTSHLCCLIQELQSRLSVSRFVRM